MSEPENIGAVYVKELNTRVWKVDVVDDTNAIRDKCTAKPKLNNATHSIAPNGKYVCVCVVCVGEGAWSVICEILALLKCEMHIAQNSGYFGCAQI